jgi:hypothetical protein
LKILEESKLDKQRWPLLKLQLNNRLQWLL